MLQASEDEEFVVIKAGPPLPLRRAKPLKSVYNSSAFSSSSPCSSSPREEGGRVNNEIRRSFLPQPIISYQQQNQANSTSHHDLNLLTSKGTQTFVYPETPKSTSTSATPTLTPSTPRSRSMSPRSSLTSSTLHRSRPVSLNVESKVKQYIAQVKKFDEEQRQKVKKRGKGTLNEKVLSLEDLYQVSPPPTEVIEDYKQLEDKLRESLRVIKEKDEVIDKLRESCHELKVKCADAENRIDEMRFGYDNNPSSKTNDSSQIRRSSFSCQRIIGSDLFSTPISHYPKRSSSVMAISQEHKSTITDETPTFSPIHLKTRAVQSPLKVNRGTATEKQTLVSRKSAPKTSDDKRTEDSTITDAQCNSSPNPLTNTDVDDIDLESRESNFDPVLEEKCSNWLEKVQNWKTDPTHNHPNNANVNPELKDKDSCGDSGFRGSAEVDVITHKEKLSAKANKTAAHSSQLCCKCQQISTENLPKQDHALIPEEKSEAVSIPALASHFMHKQEEQFVRSHDLIVVNPTSSASLTTTTTVTEAEQSNPSSLHFVQPWFTYYRHINPSSVTDYEGFPSYSFLKGKPLEFKTNQRHSTHRLRSSASLYDIHRGQSLDHGETPEDDYKDLLRSIDRQFATLHPLIESAVFQTTRCKSKSQKLDKIIDKAITSRLKESTKK